MSTGAATAASPDAPAPPLRNPNFRALMGYRICTILSYQMVAVTVGWHVYELTRNPWMLGLIGLAKHLSPTRSNGLASLLAFIREQAESAASG